WTQEEDKRMVDLKQSGLGWRKVAAMLGRKHVSCVSRYYRLEYRLWSDHELDLLQKGVQEYGRSWTKIQKTYLPHRAVQSIHERYWRSQAKRKGRFTERERALLENGAVERFGSKWTVISEFVVGKTPIQCRKEWEEKLDPAVNRAPWTNAELDRLMERRRVDWREVAKEMQGRTPQQCRIRF
ncbi:hypothetical protein B0O80DRAFT_361686, partial [Mortierella sp. GBAus27b]